MVGSVAMSWNFSLNSSKCIAMRFSAQKFEVIPAFCNIDGKYLEYLSVHRDLGVLVDSRLKFHMSISERLFGEPEACLVSSCGLLCVVAQFHVFFVCLAYKACYGLLF